MTGAHCYRRTGGAAAATVTVLALGATLTACFDSGPVTAPSGIKPPPVSTVTVTSTASTTTGRAGTTTAPRSGTSRSSASRAPSGRTMLADLRSGGHDRFDRVVVEFTGGRPAEIGVQRVKGPIHGCGSDEVVSGAGEHIMVTFDGVDMVDEAGAPAYTGPRAVAGPGAAITRVTISCSFEGRLQVAIKLAGSGQALHTDTLSDPTRFVVDMMNA